MRYVTVVGEYTGETDLAICVYNRESDKVWVPKALIGDVLGDKPELGEEYIFQIPRDVADEKGLTWE